MLIKTVSSGHTREHTTSSTTSKLPSDYPLNSGLYQSHKPPIVALPDCTLIKNVVPGSGSFVINLAAAATAETKVCFLALN